jgi:trehalose 6-phosphate phosphatase
MRDRLLSLCHMQNVVVAIVSGRALEDVRTRVGIPELIYAGCHGLVIRGPGLDFVQPQALRQVRALKHLAEQLTVRLQRVSGVNVEDKGMSVSVHFRQVEAPDRRAVALAVQTAAGQSATTFLVRRGREVWELSPKVDWDKGRAVRWILAHAAGRDALPVFIGDDVTDEDAFAALPEGITVKVGDAYGSSAVWSVAGPEEVGSFLLWLRTRLG